MTDVATTLRVRPTEPRPELLLDGTVYQLDAVALEFDVDGDPIDLRFELGSGLNIYWAVPIEQNGRLRLIHVDCAVAHVDEPTLVLDPCPLELLPLRWDGELGAVGGRGSGRRVKGISIQASASAGYHCVVDVEGNDGLVGFTLQGR